MNIHDTDKTVNVSL